MASLAWAGGVGVNILGGQDCALAVDLHEGGLPLIAQVLQEQDGGHLLAEAVDGVHVLGSSLLILGRAPGHAPQPEVETYSM